MFASVYYVDNVCNVKTNRGGITGRILPIPLPSMHNYYTHKYFLYFYIIYINFILYVYFIVHIVTVFFCMQINKLINNYTIYD